MRVDFYNGIRNNKICKFKAFKGRATNVCDRTGGLNAIKRLNRKKQRFYGINSIGKKDNLRLCEAAFLYIGH